MQRKSTRGRTALFSGVALVQAALWGIGNPLTKLLYPFITPFWLLALRFLGATVLFALFFGRRIVRNMRTLHLGGALFTGATLTLSYILAYLALQRTSATAAGFLCSIAVLFAPLFSVFVLGTRYQKRMIPAVVVVLWGLYLLCGGGDFSIGWGEVFALSSSVSFAFCLVFSEKHLQDADPIALTFFQCALASVVCLVLALAVESPVEFGMWSASAWGTLLFLIVGSSFLCYLVQNYVLIHLPSSLASLILCTESVFSALAAYLLLGERLSSTGLAGAGLILASVVLATLSSVHVRKGEVHWEGEIEEDAAQWDGIDEPIAPEKMEQPGNAPKE